jgi:hypothetical protein
MLVRRIMRMIPGRSASSGELVFEAEGAGAAPSFPEISNDSVFVAGAGAAAPPSSGDNQEGVSVIAKEKQYQRE